MALRRLLGEISRWLGSSIIERDGVSSRYSFSKMPRWPLSLFFESFSIVLEHQSICDARTKMAVAFPPKKLVWPHVKSSHRKEKEMASSHGIHFSRCTLRRIQQKENCADCYGEPNMHRSVNACMWLATGCIRRKNSFTNWIGRLQRSCKSCLDGRLPERGYVHAQNKPRQALATGRMKVWYLGSVTDICSVPVSVWLFTCLVRGFQKCSGCFLKSIHHSTWDDWPYCRMYHKHAPSSIKCTSC